MHDRSGSRSRTITYVSGGLREVVHGPIAGDGTFHIIGERYQYGGQNYLGLKITVKGTARRYSITGGSSSTSMLVTNRTPISVVIQTGCADRRPYAVVAGLLRARAASVVATRGGRPSVALQRAALPTTLGVSGVLVYALLGEVPDQIVVRSARGRKLSDERYGGLPPERCSSAGADGAAVGSVG